MNLYKVTCVSLSGKELEVYVVSTDPTAASKMAMDKMCEFQWSYDDIVSKIELVASPEQYSGPMLLIM